jgi:hypothetical protein
MGPGRRALFSIFGRHRDIPLAPGRAGVISVRYMVTSDYPIARQWFNDLGLPALIGARNFLPD